MPYHASILSNFIMERQSYIVRINGTTSASAYIQHYRKDQGSGPNTTEVKLTKHILVNVL